MNNDWKARSTVSYWYLYDYRHFFNSASLLFEASRATSTTERCHSRMWRRHERSRPTWAMSSVSWLKKGPVLSSVFFCLKSWRIWIFKNMYNIHVYYIYYIYIYMNIWYSGLKTAVKQKEYTCYLFCVELVSLNEVLVGFRLFCLGEPKLYTISQALSCRKLGEGFRRIRSPTEVRIHHEYRTFLADVG